jgi:hypothetical protein
LFEEVSNPLDQTEPNSFSLPPTGHLRIPLPTNVTERRINERRVNARREAGKVAIGAIWGGYTAYTANNGCSVCLAMTHSLPNEYVRVLPANLAAREQ